MDIPYRLRPATQEDDQPIHDLIHAVHINPMGLDWRHFILAVNPDGQMLGCGQLKSHSDGTIELASVAVRAESRGQGIARTIIETLIELHHQDHPDQPLYLTCRSSLGILYARFGFRPLEPADLPAYFRRISRLARLAKNLGFVPEDLWVMKLPAE